MASPSLRIGVDVGGTNTDAVILDVSLAKSQSKGVLAWHKEVTTADPGLGIRKAIAAVLDKSSVDRRDVSSVTIGTTHFVNAIVQRDAARLSRVAVVRLSGPFTKHAPPCIDWPEELREVILGYHCRVQGGLEVDGRLIGEIDEEEIRQQCGILTEKGIRSVVVVGVFSPIDTIEKQEERVAGVIRDALPGIDVVCSKDVANLGFLERENAAILNASVLSYARKSVQSFRQHVRALGLHCPTFITQNDGTMLSAEMAAQLPIRTFSSGTTNSIRGAAHLASDDISGAAMVLDMGGTTTDAGLLEKTGFPRQQAAYSSIAGIRINFSYPDIKSIGLGGGSLVKVEGDSVEIGPMSVGHEISTRAAVFGGGELTATDCMASLDGSLSIGNAELVKGRLAARDAERFQSAVKSKLEGLVDLMKTSPEDITILLVGGGAFLSPASLAGASKVVRPEFAQVANAVGAAISKVSATIDVVRDTGETSVKDVLEGLREEVRQRTAESGALGDTIEIVEEEVLPLQYVAGKSRFIIRAVGEFDLSRHGGNTGLDFASETLSSQDDEVTSPARLETEANKSQPVDIHSYKPLVKDRVWFVNETDLDWIAKGCYILGTGGGGSPYSQMLLLRDKLRRGATVRVVDPHDVPDDALVGSGGGAGSPTVSIEKLSADEMVEAQDELYRLLDRRPSHMIALEIGGANGLQSMILGASSGMDIPAVDGDWMGRAFPTKWQTTPVVFNERSPIWSPVSMSDGNGNVVVMTAARSDADVERIMRAALSEMGSQVGCADPPVSGAEMKRWVVENTISLSWRIGRAVERARALKDMGRFGERIVEECGGGGAAKVLWKGKIVGVQRVLRKGHVYGECVIEKTSEDGQRVPGQRERVKIPFKNENIAAIRVSGESEEERQEDVLAIAPDLVSVIDVQNGEALGTPEYRYGLLVMVLGITASDKWTSTQRGVDIGGPKAFGFGHLEYKPLGKWSKPVSVIDEYNS